MTVVRDDGIHRHLRFAEPGTSTLWFEIVTWPGALTINGDMGTYVFSRTTDMFAFFGPDRHVNLSYWAEKVRSGPHRNDGGVREFSEAEFRSHVEEQVADWITNSKLTDAAAERLRDAIAADVLIDGATSHDEGAHRALQDFSSTLDWTDDDGNEFTETFEFCDTWEWDLADYVYQFVWCCHAITWAIGRYVAGGGVIVTNADALPIGQQPLAKADTLTRGVIALVEDLTVILGAEIGAGDLRDRLDAWQADPLAAALDQIAAAAAAPACPECDAGTVVLAQMDGQPVPLPCGWCDGTGRQAGGAA
jgi:hypothetical protein